MKICLFGGTFNPPHLGHLIIAQTIFEAENFDKIIFIPANISPHKKNKKTSRIDMRVKMLDLAIKDNPNFELSNIEMARGGVSYSYETIITFKNDNNIATNDLYYLIGSDTLKNFHQWKNSKKILNECKLIVAIRPGFNPSDIPNWILSNVQFSNIPRIEISSSIIRERWKNGKTIRYMVTQPVWKYINDNKLFIK